MKSSIGLMSAKVSARPFVQEPVERVAAGPRRGRQGQNLVEVRERKTLRSAGTRRQGSTPRGWSGGASEVRTAATGARLTTQTVHKDVAWGAGTATCKHSARETERDARCRRRSTQGKGRVARRSRHAAVPLTAGPAPSTARRGTARLLELDGRASGLELGLGLLGVLLRHLLEHRLRCRVDEVLRLFQAKARERTDLLDDLDLLVASGGEDDVELVLLLGGSLAAAAAAGRSEPRRPRPVRPR